ncbi:uncharacterized protein LOC131517903 [Neofelis nebulosa]|uniref:uncharacterized protein LOC131517903 n=1 Tax=Neofelis nebulosa TaxID=61452 RepID=UPI00272D90EE|nr:uncharacterized protein LOC131517903 [Neofelis nebulosa]
MGQTGLGPQPCGGPSDPQMWLRLEASDLILHQTGKVPVYKYVTQPYVLGITNDGRNLIGPGSSEPRVQAEQVTDTIHKAGNTEEMQTDKKMTLPVRHTSRLVYKTLRSAFANLRFLKPLWSQEALLNLYVPPATNEERHRGRPSLLIPPNHTGRQVPTFSFRKLSRTPTAPLVFPRTRPNPRRRRHPSASHPSQPASTAQTTEAWRPKLWRAQRQAARRLVRRGSRDSGVPARACAEWVCTPVTERRGVGVRDLARPARPPPLGLPLRPRGASRAARPLSGGRTRPGVAQKPSSNSPWRETKFFLTSTVTETLRKLVLLAYAANILPPSPRQPTLDISASLFIPL